MVRRTKSILGGYLRPFLRTGNFFAGRFHAVLSGPSRRRQRSRQPRNGELSRPLLIAAACPGHRAPPLLVVSKTLHPARCPRLSRGEGEGHRTGGRVQNVQQTTRRGGAHEQRGSNRSVSVQFGEGSGIRREAGFKKSKVKGEHMQAVTIGFLLFILALVVECIREEFWPLK